MAGVGEAVAQPGRDRLPIGQRQLTSRGWRS
jgi:hypothetical protein